MSVTHHMADFLVGGDRDKLETLVANTLYHLSENNWGKEQQSLVLRKNETALEDLAEYINGRMTDQNWYDLFFDQLWFEKT